METETLSSGIRSKRIFMSSTESMGHAALPTSPATRGWSESCPGAWQIKGYGQTRLSRGKILPVEFIGFLRRGKSRVLADGPGLIGVHGGRGPPQIGRQTGKGVDGVQAFQIFGRINGLDGDAFRRLPVERLQGLALELPEGGFFPFLHLRMFGHDKTPLLVESGLVARRPSCLRPFYAVLF
jgi:hypothetical protein